MPRQHRGVFLLAASLVVCCLTAAFFTLSTRTGSSASPSVEHAGAEPPTVAHTPEPAQGTRERAGGPAQSVHFTLYDEGIYPREARARAGRVIIMFDDKSGGSGGLVVEREGGGPDRGVGSVRRSEVRRRGRDEFRMGPGRYRVYVAGRPANGATLIVETH